MSLTAEQVSYKVNRVSTNVEAEIRRLKAQVELFWTKELSVYKHFGLTDGMQVLEAGSGPGFLMEKIVASFPNCHVTGIETDPLLVETARKNFDGKGLRGYSLAQQSIMNMNFADNTFDFAITRLVLEHLPDPLGAVKEIYRVLKPGAVAIFVDNDFEMHLRTFPDIPELNALYEAYCEARVSEGGNPRIGRELPGIMKKGGFREVDMEIVLAHSEIVGDAIFQRSEGSGIPAKLVEDGFLSRDLLDTIARKWVAMLETEDHALFRQLFVACGKKGTTPDETPGRKPKRGIGTGIESGPGDLSRKAPAERRELLAEYVGGLIADALHISKSEMRLDIPVIEFGFDSLMAVQVKNSIKSALDVDISVIDFFENQGVADITSSIMQKLNDLTSSTVAEPLLATSEQNDTADEGGEMDWEEGEL